MSRPASGPLTGEELAVLRACARGDTVVEIAAALAVSRWLVQHRRRVIREKLEARSIAHAIAIASRTGILDVGPRATQAIPITEGQLRAFHAKAAAVDDSLDRRSGTKVEALERASARFGRPIEHVRELSTIEASWVLDLLEDWPSSR